MVKRAVPKRADDKRVSKGRVPKKVAASEAKPAGTAKPVAVVKPKRPHSGRPKKVT
jgi:hypothetical protein